MFGEGISKEGELIDYGVKLDVVDKSGTWFSYKEIRLGQGKEKSKAFLKENLVTIIAGNYGRAAGVSYIKLATVENLLSGSNKMA